MRGQWREEMLKPTFDQVSHTLINEIVEVGTQKQQQHNHQKQEERVEPS